MRLCVRHARNRPGQAAPGQTRRAHRRTAPGRFDPRLGRCPPPRRRDEPRHLGRPDLPRAGQLSAHLRWPGDAGGESDRRSRDATERGRSPAPGRPGPRPAPQCLAADHVRVRRCGFDHRSARRFGAAKAVVGDLEFLRQRVCRLRRRSPGPSSGPGRRRRTTRSAAVAVPAITVTAPVDRVSLLAGGGEALAGGLVHPLEQRVGLRQSAAETGMFGHCNRPGSCVRNPFWPPSTRSSVCEVTFRPRTAANRPISTPSTSNRNRDGSGGSPPRWVCDVRRTHGPPPTLARSTRPPRAPSAPGPCARGRAGRRAASAGGRRDRRSPARVRRSGTRSMRRISLRRAGSPRPRTRVAGRAGAARVVPAGRRLAGGTAGTGRRGLPPSPDPTGGGRSLLCCQQRLVLLLVAEVDHAVEVLEERQVGREQALDLVRRHQRPSCRASRPPGPGSARSAADRPGRCTVRIPQRLQLVARGRQPHGAVAVHPAGGVDIAARQGELVRGLSGSLDPRERLDGQRDGLLDRVVRIHRELVGRDLARPAVGEVEPGRPRRGWSRTSRSSRSCGCWCGRSAGCPCRGCR